MIGFHYSQESVIIGGDIMKAGNIEPKEKIHFDYSQQYPPKFKNTIHDRKLIIKPFQTYTIDNISNDYKPLSIDCPILEIDYDTLILEGLSYWDKLNKKLGSNKSVYWLDPTYLTTECICSILINWRESKISSNVTLAIMVHNGIFKLETGCEYVMWKVEPSTLLYEKSLVNPIWYPSLERPRQDLLKIIEEYNPYDVFPLIEFPMFATQYGESSLTDHSELLEKTRTRTRNFIYYDIIHPTRAFDQFYGMLDALPKSSSSIFQSVITPGGVLNGYLTALLSGALSNSYFLTPKNEIPVNSYLEIKGIMFLRKIT